MESKAHNFGNTGNRHNYGYMPFARKLAQQLEDLALSSVIVRKNLEVNKEWSQFYSTEIVPIAELESAPLLHDPRAPVFDDDNDMDFFLRLTQAPRISRSQKHKKIDVEEVKKEEQSMENFKKELSDLLLKDEQIGEDEQKESEKEPIDWDKEDVESDEDTETELVPELIEEEQAIFYDNQYWHQCVEGYDLGTLLSNYI